MRSAMLLRMLLAAPCLLLVGVPDVFAQGAPVCTTTTIAARNFLGISGSGDDNVIGVGAGGIIYQFDGSAWSQMASPTTRQLNDVEVVNSSTAFAVGNNGTVLQLSGGTWTSIGGFTGRHLLGVWSDSSGEVFVVGASGSIWRWDGRRWQDQSRAARTGNQDIEDVWGDDDFVYAISRRGDLHVYDRSRDRWARPDTLCPRDNFYRDIWGDGSGSLYLVNRENVYVHDGASCQAVATASARLNTVYGAPDGTVYAAGRTGVSLVYDGTSWTESNSANAEINDAWVSPSGVVYYAGDGGQTTICNAGGSAAFNIVHDGWGIHCLAETVRVDVIDSVAGTPLNSYNAEITLDTQSGNGSWTLLAGGGTLTDATADDGIATYQWPLGETTASFALSYPQGTAAFDIDAWQSNDPGIRDNDAEGLMQFTPSGFTVSSAPLTNPPPAVIPPFTAPQTAAVNFPVYLTAYGQTPADPVCGVIESYDGARNLGAWYDYVDPVSGSLSPALDTQPLPAAEPAAANLMVTFSAGQAVLNGVYDDAGMLRLHFKDEGFASPDLPAGIRGSTANFVVRPAGFVLSGITDATGNPNPGAADATGPAFIAAGAPFAATVTAINAVGNATPNFGRELAPESVRLEPTLVAPAGGQNPPVRFATGFGPFSGGSATGSDFAWPEVGIIRLTPAIGDGDYLGSGDVVGTASANVGRFHPAYFEAALNAPAFATSCAAGNFSYLGESFTYSTPPVITLSAREAAGGVTENYAGAFFRIDNSTLANRQYTAATGSLDTSGLPDAASDPVVTSLGAGIGTLTFGSGSGLRFARGAPEAPFSADIQLSIEVFDADAVAAAANPVVFGNPGGMLFDAGSEMRYGRMRVVNALGSELVNLHLPLQAEYYAGAGTGFVSNTDDACTSGVSLTLGPFTGNLAAGETCVIENGAPGASGAACAAPGPAGLRFREPPLGGDFNLYLAAPGDGNDGSVGVSADVPSWLRFDWDVAAPGFENPSGIARFGIYRGEDRRIYTRELY